MHHLIRVVCLLVLSFHATCSSQTCSLAPFLLMPYKRWPRGGIDDQRLERFHIVCRPLQSERVLGAPGQALPVLASHRQMSSEQFGANLFIKSEAISVSANSLQHIWRTVKALRESVIRQILRTFLADTTNR